MKRETVRRSRARKAAKKQQVKTEAVLERRNLTARRGPEYEVFLQSGWAARIEAREVTQSKVAATLGVSVHAISGWMTAYREDCEITAMQEEWTVPMKARKVLLTIKPVAYNELRRLIGKDIDRAVDKIVLFRSGWFKDETGNPYTTPDFQREWLRTFLEAIVGARRAVVLAPPRHGKSQLLIHLGIWLLIHCPNIRILWVAGNGDIAETMGGGMRDELENNVDLNSDFLPPGETFRPRGRSGNTWRDKEFSVSTRTVTGIKSASFQALGCGGKILSRDADLIIGDDVIDIEDAFSPAERSRKAHWINALADDTPILTSDGWKTVGEVREGNEIVGLDGRYTKVLGVAHHEDVRLYRFTFSTGGHVVAAANHRWWVIPTTGHNRNGRGRVMTTEQILADTHTSQGYGKWAIPLMAPYEGHTYPLPVDPYILGLWLGDGEAGRGLITSGVDDAPHVLTGLQQAGYRVVSQRAMSRGRVTGIAFNLNLGHGRGFIAQANQLGILYDKKIPDAYLRASIQDRLALLQGLADSDGTISKIGLRSFASANPELTHGFRVLVSSLGGTWTGRTRENRGFGGGSRQITETFFWLPAGMSAFRLLRKKERERPDLHARHRVIRSIEPAGHGSATCFGVDAPDSLYAAGWDFTISHNTQVSSRKEDHSALIFIGSRQHHLDWWGEAAENAAWGVKVYSAHDFACDRPLHPHGIPIGHTPDCAECATHIPCVLWPQRRPMGYLQDQRAGMVNDAHFEMVYYNHTRPDGGVAITREALIACTDSRRRLGTGPSGLPIDPGTGAGLEGCILVAGLDPATHGDQASFLWALDLTTRRRYMVDLDITRGGGLPGANAIIRHWNERYGCKTWVVERNGYQEAIIQDTSITDYCASHGISLVPHFTHAQNKLDPNFGVTAMFNLYLTPSPDGTGFMVSLPWGDDPAREKVGVFIKQVLSFEDGRAAKRKTDLVMASWFPDSVIRRWYADMSQFAVTQHPFTPYPTRSLGDSYRYDPSGFSTSRSPIRPGVN